MTFVIGTRLQASGRRMVLYLRRFGYTEATRTVTRAVSRIGGYWRVVTLDDGRVTPVGVRGRDAVEAVGRIAWAGNTVTWILLRTLQVVAVVTVCLSAAVMALLLAEAFRFHTDVVVRIEGFLHVRNAHDLMDLFSKVGPLILGFCIFLPLAVVLLQIALIPVRMAATFIADNVRAADKGKSLRIVDAESIAAAQMAVRQLSRRMISPRLFVLTVHSGVWQYTVAAFGTDAAVPLIDVTEPTENILWEIDHMRAVFGPDCVFVGQHERLGHLRGVPEPSSVAARLRERLDACHVLAYQAAGHGTRHFTRSLRATLEAHARSSRRHGPRASHHRGSGLRSQRGTGHVAVGADRHD